MDREQILAQDPLDVAAAGLRKMFFEVKVAGIIPSHNTIRSMLALVALGALDEVAKMAAEEESEDDLPEPPVASPGDNWDMVE